MHVNAGFSDMYKVQGVQRSKPCRSQEARRELETLGPTELPDEGLIDADPGLENRDHSWNRQDRRRPVRESLRVDTLPENRTHVAPAALVFLTRCVLDSLVFLTSLVFDLAGAGVSDARWCLLTSGCWCL
ncbi:unnamed protein product [Boreogadus saida]